MVDVFLVNLGLDNCPREKVNTSEPLGLGYIASSLEALGFSVELLDLAVSNLTAEEASQKIFDLEPAVVGFSVYTGGLRGAYSMIGALREGGLSSRIVCGGPHITADPDIVAELGADCGLRGEAEGSFGELCLRFRGGSLGEVPGFVGKLGSRFVVGEPQTIQNINELPNPKRDPKTMKQYNHLVVIASRGCPNKCSFCSNAGTGYRQRSPQKIMEEIQDINSIYGVKKIDFVDDVFGLNKEKTLELCRLLRKSGLDLTWNCTTRADCIDEQLLNTMHDAGLAWVSVGVESGSEKIRMQNGKSIRDKVYEKFFAACKRIGVKTRAYMMLGLPGEKLGDLETTKLFAEKLAPDEVQYNIIDVLPKTEVCFGFLRQENKNKTLWRNYMRGREKYPIYVPEGMNRGEFYDEINRLFGPLPFGRDVI